MVNIIYLIVAILTFISWTKYVVNEQLAAGIWTKRFFYVMKVVFLITNIICLALIKHIEYFKFKRQEIYGYILFGIPIIIYIVDFISFILKKENILQILWGIYFVLLTLCVFTPPCIKNEDILQESQFIVSCREEIVKSNFLSNSVQGIDYIIKQQNSAGREKEEIIKTRTYKDKVNVEIYPHQESSYIEKYINVETYISFFGNKFEKNTDKIIYKIYLTDELYQSE